MNKNIIISLITITFLGTVTWTVGQNLLWQDTNPIRNGQVINADIIRNNFDWLKQRVDRYEGDITNILARLNEPAPAPVTPAPPTCTGNNQTLQWDGTQWECHAHAPCALDNVIVPHGESLIFYLKNYITVYSAQSYIPSLWGHNQGRSAIECLRALPFLSSFAQERTCNNGVLSGDSAYMFSSCWVTIPPRLGGDGGQ